MTRKPYPTPVSDEQWAFVAPDLTLMTEDAPQREHSLPEVFNRVRPMVRTGGAWRLMPDDLPPWYTVYQQTRTLAESWGVRGNGAGVARDRANCVGALRATECGDSGQSDKVAIHS